MPNYLEVILWGYLFGLEAHTALAVDARAYRDDHPALARETTGVDPSRENELPIVDFLRPRAGLRCC